MHLEHFAHPSELVCRASVRRDLVGANEDEGGEPEAEHSRVDARLVAGDDASLLELANAIEDRRGSHAESSRDLGICHTAVGLEQLEDLPIDGIERNGPRAAGCGCGDVACGEVAGHEVQYSPESVCGRPFVGQFVQFANNRRYESVGHVLVVASRPAPPVLSTSRPTGILSQAMTAKLANATRIDPHSPVTSTQPDDNRVAERALVDRARLGDVAAFESIYRTHAGRVYALCLRMTADTGQARELVQDVFIRVWEKLSSYRGEAALSSWVHRIAVNVVLMTRRSDRRREQRVARSDDLDPSGATLEGDVDPPDVEQEIDLERAVAALPPGARRVFVLHDIEGYRHDEIAQMTGNAEGTLRAQLHRARRLLMEALRK
jgi:RNA polymerase sigma-70 factor, ECF subfamily